jgi:hypothetical protein
MLPQAIEQEESHLFVRFDSKRNVEKNTPDFHIEKLFSYQASKSAYHNRSAQFR